jgi:cytochrome bd ubiquinol oxidase subunit II
MMETIWFILVAMMLTAYVVFDGFDLGAGIVSPLVAKSDAERTQVLRTVGPVWDGNEVWLISAGGTLFFAFPMLYAVSFSGFYLPLHMVLWLLIFRALGIELRGHVPESVWRNFFDGAFTMSSALLAVFFGAALGNVIRGVPIRDDGYFFAPLWTDWRVGPNPGILDWYTVLAGLLALAALAQHGSLYLALKTEGAVNERAKRIASFTWIAVVVLTALSLVATLSALPGIARNYTQWPVGYVIPVGVIASLLAVSFYHRRGRERDAFLGSCAYLIFMLVGAAFALYPRVLPASNDPARSLTIHNTATGPYSMKGGLVWWTFGMLIAIGYFVFVYRMFRGKVKLEGGEHAY